MNEAKQYFLKVQEVFEKNANPALAVDMAAYLRNRFEFYGIKSPQRRSLLKMLYKTEAPPSGESLKTLCRQLWKMPQREMHYAAMEIMEKQIRKCDVGFLDLIEEMIPVNAWWDSVDFLSPRLAGRILFKNPAAISAFPDRWIESKNFWYQRAAILFQLKYKNKTDQQRLFSYIRKVSDSDEFFLQKGSGWALREFSKSNPEAVKNFIQSTKLKPLTVREGLKRIKSEN